MLYRFKIELSDIERSIYESLDFRLPMHPSETPSFMLTRVLAYALSWTRDLEFAPGGLSDREEPTIFEKSPGGGYSMWIEIGNPAARRVHKASKASELLKIFTYKDPNALVRELNGEKIHRKDEIELFSFSTSFLSELEQTLKKETSWNLVRDSGSLTISTGDLMITGEARKHSLVSA